MDFRLTAEQSAMVEMASGLAARADPDPSVTWEEAGRFPWEFMAELAAQDLTGIDLPGRVGGQGLELIDAVLALAAVAETAPHLADAVQAANFGAVRPVAAFG